MSRRFARRFLIFATMSCCLAAVWAEEPPRSASQQELLVLRNGEVLAGRVARDGDYYRVLLPDGELRVRSAEAELVCRNFDEAYNFKRKRLALGRADDHLDLADWCLRQSLPGYAAKEIAAAMALDPQNPRTEFLDRRLQQMLEAPPTASSGKGFEVTQVTNEDLDRLVRGMPPGTVEAFTSTIQPLLMNSCATSSCHGPASKSSYILLRIPGDRTGSRRLTQRNLQSTVTMLDYQNPQQSRLLTAASRAHGTAVSAIFDPQTVKYRQLFLWIASVTQRAGVPDLSDQPATVGIGGQATRNLNQSTEAPSAATGDIDEPHPSRPVYRNRFAKPAVTRSDGESGQQHTPEVPQQNATPSVVSPETGAAGDGSFNADSSPSNVKDK
jgi:hypothetical protein